MTKPKTTREFSTFLEIGKGEISALLELDQYGDFTGKVYLNAENDKDRAILQRKVLPLLRGKKLTIIYGRPDK